MARSTAVMLRAANRKEAVIENAPPERRGFRLVLGKLGSERRGSLVPRLSSFSPASVVALALPRGLLFVVLLLALLGLLGGHA